MVEMVSTIAITVCSILLLCYWFRYTCHLILSAATARDYCTNFAETHQLGFQEAQRRLHQGTTEFDAVKDMLDRDYAVLARLMDRAESSAAGVERRMLAIHYRLMSLSYRASNRLSASTARKALEEMSMVVAHFANVIGEAAISPASP